MRRGGGQQSLCNAPRTNQLKASVFGCLPLAAPIGLSPLLILTLCGPERVLVVSTEPPDDLSCLTTPGVGRAGDVLRVGEEGGGGGMGPKKKIVHGSTRCTRWHISVFLNDGHFGLGGGGAGWHVAFGVLFSSAAGGAHWPIATYRPSLEPSRSVAGGAHWPLTAPCPSSSSVPYPSFSTSLPFPLEPLPPSPVVPIGLSSLLPFPVAAGGGVAR